MRARISASWPEKVFEVQLISSSPAVSQLTAERRCAERGTVTRRSRVGDWFNNGETNHKNLGRDGQTGLPSVGLYLGTACSFKENSIRKKNGLTFNRSLDSCEETDERRDKKHTRTQNWPHLESLELFVTTELLLAILLVVSDISVAWFLPHLIISSYRLRLGVSLPFIWNPHQHHNKSTSKEFSTASQSQ